jgi:NodT family efflux transporter outer membrane factor (OMF) lipoprotein
VLVGENAATFALAPETADLPLVAVPVSAPSRLLQRRPDIAAAERRAFAANARIGVARAALFPTLTLDATGGWQAAGGANLLTAPNLFWVLGPQLAGPIFDGGRRRAGVRVADADLEAAGAAYRAVVLAAFQDVEDQLVLCNNLADQARDQDIAVAAGRRSQQLATLRYRAGAAPYIEVVLSQTTALTAERAAIVLRTRRAQAAVGLIRALGGGWR